MQDGTRTVGSGPAAVKAEEVPGYTRGRVPLPGELVRRRGTQCRSFTVPAGAVGTVLWVQTVRAHGVYKEPTVQVRWRVAGWPCTVVPLSWVGPAKGR